jgi:cell division transport system ATP-binding protein
MFRRKSLTENANVCFFEDKITTIRQNGRSSGMPDARMSMEYVAWLQDASIYHGERKILADVNMSLSRAEFVYLVGRTGTGKTSVLKTLWGEIPLKQGKGKVAGMDLVQLTEATTRDLRRKLGIVFQDFYLFEDWSVQDNLHFVLEATGWKESGKRQQRISQVLVDVGLGGVEESIAGRLSGGEQQRLVIARAILNNPEIIIADEPTGNLDNDTSVEIMRLLRSLAVQYNTAIFMATHDYGIIERFPGRVYRCENEKVHEVD